MRNLQDITHFPIDGDTTAERGFITEAAIHATNSQCKRSKYQKKKKQQKKENFEENTSKNVLF